MRKVQERDISEILKKYMVIGKVDKVTFLHESYEEEEALRVRVISKVQLEDGSLYIIKFILEEEHPFEIMEEQSVFSECLRSFGINTARRLKCQDRYCCLYFLDEVELTVTLEEYLGEEIIYLNEEIIKEIARLMAKMHKISEENKCHIGIGTIWDLWNEDSDIMRGYIRFKELEDEIMALDENNKEIYKAIIELYELRKNHIFKLKNKLPRYATQGDYSINNLTYENKKIGVFDYNIAGDEFLVIDMIIEGLFISKVMELSEELCEDNRDQLFRTFVLSYRDFRKLTIEELQVINDLYAIVVPFWWQRVIFDEEKSLVSILSSKDSYKLKDFLEETYRILKSNYF